MNEVAEKITHPCLNPNCKDGWVKRKSGGVSVCVACDGIGYFPGIGQARLAFFRGRKTATALTIQSYRGKAYLDPVEEEA